MNAMTDIDALKRKFCVDTDADLSRALGVDQSTVSTWKSRGRVPKLYLQMATKGTGRDLAEGLRELMRHHGATSRTDLCVKLGVSKNTIRNWELAGEIPARFLGATRKPWQLLAALSVLRDGAMTDAEARKAALTFLQQMEVAHG